MIIIDYLQLMDGLSNQFETGEQKMIYIVNSLKMIAQELNIPILVTSQINRTDETNRNNIRPQLNDLLFFKGFEKNTDVVFFIHRPEYYCVYLNE